MKKIILLILLVPFFGFAKYYEGTIKFTNGKSLKGLIEIPDVTDKTVNFKLSESAKTEKYIIDEIVQLDFPTEKNETVTYIASLYYKSTMIGKVKGVSEKKIWLQVIYDGKLKMYIAVDAVTSYGMGSRYGGKTTTTVSYYLKAPNREYPQKVFEEYPNSAVVGQFKIVKKLVETYIKDDCPALVDLLDKKDLKEKGYIRIGELYDQNCGK